MKICDPHWEKVKEAVKEAGMYELVAHTQEEAMEKFYQRLEGKGFEPLQEICEYFVNEAIKNGGIGVCEVDETSTENEGHLCPVCLFIEHAKDYDLDKHLKDTTEDMAAWCRKKGYLTVS